MEYLESAMEYKTLQEFIFLKGNLPKISHNSQFNHHYTVNI